MMIQDFIQPGNQNVEGLCKLSEPYYLAFFAHCYLNAHLPRIENYHDISGNVYTVVRKGRLANGYVARHFGEETRLVLKSSPVLCQIDNIWVIEGNTIHHRLFDRRKLNGIRRESDMFEFRSEVDEAKRKLSVNRDEALWDILLSTLRVSV